MTAPIIDPAELPPNVKNFSERVLRERPLPFIGAMVRAVLHDRKSQTRRVVTPQPTGEPRPLEEWSRRLAATCGDSSPDPSRAAEHVEKLRGNIFPFTSDTGSLVSPTCPVGRPGDRLWVRESYRLFKTLDHLPASQIPPGQLGRIWYEADGEKDTSCGRLRAARFMPRSFSRITLQISGIRIERLQQITDEDAIAEGIERVGDAWKSYETILGGRHRGTPHPHSVVPNASPTTSYRELWDSLNADRGHGCSWAGNPWVWAIEFKRIDRHEVRA